MNNFGVGDWIVLSVTAVGLVCLLLLFIFKVLKLRVKVKKDDETISVGTTEERAGVSNEGKESNESIPETKSKSPHSNCIHGKDVILILQAQRKADARISHIKDIELIEEQMKLAEDCVDRIMSQTRSSFLTLLKQYREDGYNLIEDHNYRVYQSALIGMIPEFKRIFRSIARDNHLAEMDESEFKRYKEGKVPMFHSAMTEFLDLTYTTPQDTMYQHPTRIEVYDWNVNQMTMRIIDMDRLIENALESMRDSSLKLQTLSKQLEDDIEKMISELFG